jgi:hypothetical protein
MRTLTLAAPLFCTISLAALPARAAEPGSARDEAIRALRDLGAKVVVDEQAPGRPAIEVLFNRTKILASDLRHLARLPHLRRIDLYGTGVTDAGLKHLEKLTELEVLEVNGKVTDAGLMYLRNLTELRELYLYGTDITDAGLEHLTRLKRLRVLDLTATDVSAAGLAELQKALPDVKIER